MIVGARRIGFAVSGVLHLAIAGAFLLQGAATVESAPRESMVALSLDMFEAPDAEVVRHEVRADPLPIPPAPEEPPPPTPEPQISAEPPMPEKPPVEPPKARPVAAPRRPRPPPKTVVETLSVKTVEPDPATGPVAESKQVSPPVPAEERSVANRVAALPPSEAVDAGRLRKAYLAALVKAIHRRKHYPRQSRRRSEEGTVVVGFVIEKDGRLGGFAVKRSSGVRRLDNAALKTLRSLTPFRPIPDALNLDRWPITVPIEFSLR